MYHCRYEKIELTIVHRYVLKTASGVPFSASLEGQLPTHAMSAVSLASFLFPSFPHPSWLQP